jgi:hypothetical protein
MPIARAKSFAVPEGTTASGIPAPAACAATLAMVPSPLATTTRSGPLATAPSGSSTGKDSTWAPWRRSASSTSSLVSSRPEPGLASRAIRTRQVMARAATP